MVEPSQEYKHYVIILCCFCVIKLYANVIHPGMHPDFSQFHQPKTETLKKWPQVSLGIPGDCHVCCTNFRHDC